MDSADADTDSTDAKVSANSVDSADWTDSDFTPNLDTWAFSKRGLLLLLLLVAFSHLTEGYL